MFPLLLLGAIGTLVPLIEVHSFVLIAGDRTTVRQRHGPPTITTSTTTKLYQQQHEIAFPAPDILYESNRILAIHKPQGISHHDDGEKDSGIVSLVRTHQANGNIAYQGRIYGVHRLDRVTSGILLFAKDSETAKALSNKFRDGEITKYYCGISGKKPTKKKQGWVKGNMVKGRRKSWMLNRDGERDNFAETRFFTSGLSSLAEYRLEVAPDDAVEEMQQPKTLVLFRPYTGRTHQLRVAAKSVGLPLLGDPIYKDGTNNNDAKTPSATRPAATRTYLHACALRLTLHDDDDGDEEVTIWSPPPFGDCLWNSSGSHKFDEVFQKLVQKQCDCNAIKDEMLRTIKI